MLQHFWGRSVMFIWAGGDGRGGCCDAEPSAQKPGLGLFLLEEGGASLPSAPYKVAKKVISCFLCLVRDRLQSHALKFCSMKGVGWEKYLECKKSQPLPREGSRCLSPEGLEKRLGRSLPGLGGDCRCPATAPFFLKNGGLSGWAGWRSCGQGSGVWAQACYDSPLNGQRWQRAGSIFLSEYPLIN